MQKVLLIAFIGFVIFLVSALIRNPKDILPPLLTDNSKSSNNTSPKDAPSNEECPSPFIFELPIDVGRATSVLYPGQYRGGDYKAHGGFRFDGSKPSDIQVIAPYDAEVIAGSRYPAEKGQIQYSFDFAHPCGIRYRFMHLLTLTPKFQAIADKFPLPETADSRTTEVRPSIKVKQGEVIATAVGMTNSSVRQGGMNVFVDFGVYDYRKKNDASNNPGWLAKHPSEIEQYGVCWFDWISPEDKAKVLALPAGDAENGKKSDYCN